MRGRGRERARENMTDDILIHSILYIYFFYATACSFVIGRAM